MKLISNTRLDFCLPNYQTQFLIGNLFLVDRTLAVGAEVYRLEITVKNKGDDAYNTKLYVTIPKGIKVKKVEGGDVSCKDELQERIWFTLCLRKNLSNYISGDIREI